MEDCTAGLLALEDTLYVIGGKWKLKIISALRMGGISRFNQLQQTVTGISERILSKELKELEWGIRHKDKIKREYKEPAVKWRTRV